MGLQEMVKTRFEAWYNQYGTQAKKGRYLQALRDPNYVLTDRSTNPVPGYQQHIDISKFPGHSIYEWIDLDRIKTLFLETPKDKVADDGSMHTAIGNYALWLRITREAKEWVFEPLWEGDDVPPGSGAKSRIKTLNSNGFDFVKVWESHKRIYMLKKYLAAIRTKPFILLAGISGTGKSRMVRQLAQGCCPEGHELGKDMSGKANAATKPGNFELIPVRPNWHDSSELMGYVTRITDDNKPKYVIKPFVKFLAKAMLYKDVPFFLCLDEMNLAPVEQYFAEYLSVVETRKVVKDDAGAVVDITSDVLVDFDQPEIDIAKTVQELMKDWIDVELDGTVAAKPGFPMAKAVYDRIVEDKGVRIPRNFVVMGTVNMDETTCSFSRKVLDRAMTFELNEVDMDAGLATRNDVPYGAIPADMALATAVEGFDFYSNNKELCDTVKVYLTTINIVLEGTPFKFAYRSRNEIMLYCIERMKSGIVELSQALDEATSMKVLSRIEGDEQKLTVAKHDGNGKVVIKADGKTPEMVNLLEELQTVIPAALKKANNDHEPNPPCKVCADKLAFMRGRLESGFTNFFV